MEINKIELPLFDLNIDRIVKKGPHYLILDDGFFVYHVEVLVEVQPNVKEGEYDAKERFTYYECNAFKSAITAVDINYSEFEEPKYNNWAVEISVNGMADRIQIKLSTRKEAVSLKAAVWSWLKS